MSLTVARRYARALYEEAAQKKCVELVDEDITMVQESLAGSPELKRLFVDPVISGEKKESVVVALLKDHIQPTTLGFMKLLIQKGREMLFLDVAKAYQALRDDQRGIVEAHVRTALALSEAEQKKIAAGIESMTGSKVRLITDVDRSLLGGLVIRVGDTVYDGSVRHQLSTLHNQLELSNLMSN